uniref:Uncharacterized protein n=1 Tax=Tanacetum cinerariifolium TaxID=118510 RepID=A0A699KMP1_TANCI|nr:hypothetical protein [Tanacetum cinerariifolium]
MAAPGPSNLVAKRVIDDLVDFSCETVVPKYMKFFIVQQIAEAQCFVNLMRDEARTTRNCITQLNVMIAEMEAMEDQEEVYESLMCLRDGQSKPSPCLDRRRGLLQV